MPPRSIWVDLTGGPTMHNTEQIPEISRRQYLRVLAMSAAAWGLGGPISLPLAQAQTQTQTGNKAPELLRIGHQKSAVKLVVLKQQGVLEKRFPTTRVQWLEFPAGPQLLEALSVGSLEFG